MVAHKGTPSEAVGLSTQQMMLPLVLPKPGTVIKKAGPGKS